jgi:2-polyprenyl-3-methyl-5-hydroxy-6-metoxy-1,4-benzoquinol methylase
MSGIALADQSHALSRFYAQKDAAYFNGARLDFIARLPREASAAILEVGCGTGATGAAAMAAGKAGRYVGIEIDPGSAEAARDVLAEVVVGDVERLSFDWQPATFDGLILSEVLEHLVDPWATMARLARVVRPGAMVLASSPNIAHWRVIREIALGHFRLTDRGVFDRTHLRWFTPESFAALFEGAGFRVEHIGPVTPFSARTARLCRLAGGRLDHLFMTQIAVQARKR